MSSAGSILCFGEMLWDLFPTGPIPGGAPMNVALHLHSLGNEVHLLSRIGDDGPGNDLLSFAQQRGLSTDLIQIDPDRPTGTVQVILGAQEGEVSYEISSDVAWDGIEFNSEVTYLNSSFLIYSSLASRSAVSFKALQRYLGLSMPKVFDLNLRPPYDDREKIEVLLRQADMVKLNEQELMQVAPWYDVWGTESKYRLHELMEKFDIATGCLTLGGEGAMLIEEGKVYHQEAFPIQMADAVGCGDAFIAGLLHQKMKGANPKDALAFACATGALVGTHEGATPAITSKHIYDLMEG